MRVRAVLEPVVRRQALLAVTRERPCQRSHCPPKPLPGHRGARVAWRLTALPPRQAIIKAEPTDSLVSPVRTMAMDALSYLR